MNHSLLQRAWSQNLSRPLRLSIAGLLAAALVPLTALPSQAAPTPCWDDVYTDLDGGGPDVVVGLPSYDLPGKVDAGAIVVFSNVANAGQANPKAPTGQILLTAADFGLATQAGARFGAAVVAYGDAGDFDDPDDCADLLVGAPGTSVGGQAGAGRVYKLGGAPGGLNVVKETFDEAGLDGTGGSQAGAGFGAAIAAEALGTIAIGVPGRDVSGAADAGRVVRLDYLTSDGVPEVSLVEQGTSGAGAPEAGDRFGEVLELMSTGDGNILVIGVPAEDVGTRVDAGAVGMSPLEGPLTMVTQDSPGAGGRQRPVIASVRRWTATSPWWSGTQPPSWSAWSSSVSRART